MKNVILTAEQKDKLTAAIKQALDGTLSINAERIKGSKG